MKGMYTVVWYLDKGYVFAGMVFSTCGMVILDKGMCMVVWYLDKDMYNV